MSASIRGLSSQRGMSTTSSITGMALERRASSLIYMTLLAAGLRRTI